MENTKKKSGMDRFISGMEQMMRFVPSPVKIFLWLIAFISVIALLVSVFGGEIINPANGEAIIVKNPISKQGIQWLLNNFIKNITGYMAFGPVLIMMLGVGTCEQSGLMGTLMKKMSGGVSDHLVPLMICFIGVMGNAAGNSSIFVLTPLAGFAYLAIGKSPLLGMMTCYIANISGMSANLILTETDVLCTGITNSILESAGINMKLDVTCNWYFMIVSAFVMTITCYLISEHILSKQFFVPTAEEIIAAGGGKREVTKEQNMALGKAGITLIGYLAAIIFGIVTGILKDEEGTIAPILDNLPVLFFFGFIFAAWAYGKSVHCINNIDDIVKMMRKAVQKMSSYIVLVVVISQFTALLSWTQLTKVMSALGANFLEATNMTGFSVILLFMLLCMTVNLFITSMSAMYNIFGPVAVPIFTSIGWHPALTQAAFRIADSCTNVMSPTSAFLYMIIDIGKDTFKAQESECTVAKWMSCLVPASLIMTVVWTALLGIWVFAGLPLGPNAGIYMS